MAKESLSEQMREFLERHSTNLGQTIFLDGKAAAAAVSGALQERLPGTPWYEDRFQRAMVTDERGDSLVVLATRETLDSDRRGAVHITLTTYGLDDDAFSTAREDWWSWWSSQVESPELTSTATNPCDRPSPSGEDCDRLVGARTNAAGCFARMRQNACSAVRPAGRTPADARPRPR